MEDFLQDDSRPLDLEKEESDLERESSSDFENQDGSENNCEEITEDFLENAQEPCDGEYNFTDSGENCESENAVESGNLFENGKERKKESVASIITTVVLAFLCVALVFVKFVWLYCVVVDGDSMNDTLQTGDYLLVDRLAKIDRGDVIVFTLEKSYIKRAVALEGDTVRIENGNLYVKKAGESEFRLVEYEGVVGETYYSYSNHSKVFEQVISDGCVFALGDNRENSTDSRVLGEIQIEDINGVVHQFVIDKKDGTLGKLYKYV